MCQRAWGLFCSTLHFMLGDLIAKLAREEKIDVIVRVRPHAARTRFVDMMDDGSMKIEITAPAEDGKGNAALATFLGELFGVPAGNVKILSGKAARLKLVRILT